MESQPSVIQNPDRTYEVIPPLLHEPTTENDQQITFHGGEHFHVCEQDKQIINTTTGEQLLQGHSPGEVDGENNEQDQQHCEDGDQEDLDVNRNIYFTLEPQSKEEVEQVDTPILYEIPVPDIVISHS